MHKKVPTKDKVLDKPRGCEKSLVTCEITHDESWSQQIQLNIDAKLLPSHIQTHEDALAFANNKLFGTGNGCVANEICQRAAGALPYGITKPDKGGTSLIT